MHYIDSKIILHIGVFVKYVSRLVSTQNEPFSVTKTAHFSIFYCIKAFSTRMAAGSSEGSMTRTISSKAALRSVT